ncbi:phage integrase family protein (plasmid) [Rhizobium favelukesii]|uniref:Phage integrase family protein n=1 Tax=Rhizobium favelukesii TaxID=348824 RepID=W6RIA0_9HYPH|nr:phage integrase family protein [Rhizobium favelukesii]
MPAAVETGLRAERLLRADRPHAPDTVRRRLTSWSILTRWRGLSGAFAALSVKTSLRLAVNASKRPRQRKSKRAVTGDVLAKLLSACAGDRLVDLRDRALLLVAFASGGRRRSEVAALRVEDLVDEEPVRTDPADKSSPPLPCLTIHLGRTKTTTADDDGHVVLIGRPVTALKHWLAEAKIDTGPAFRRIDQWGNIDRRALTPQSVNLILKARVKRSSGILGAWPALRLSDRGRQPWHSAPRSDAAVAAQVSDAGGQLLQQRRTQERACGATDRLSATRRRVAHRLIHRTVRPSRFASPRDRRQALSCPRPRRAASATPSRLSAFQAIGSLQVAGVVQVAARVIEGVDRPALPPVALLPTAPSALVARPSPQSTVSSPR